MPINLKSRGPEFSDGKRFDTHFVELKFTGLTKEEAEMVGALSTGKYWIRGLEGRVQVSPGWGPAPEPAVDEEMLPFWRARTEVERATWYQTEMFDPGSLGEFSSPSIEIGSLCGYYYSPENYRKEADKLTRWGFECLRSRRGSDGKFWERWYLVGLWSAREELELAIRGMRGKEALDTAVTFLCGNALFGTLNVTVQQAAMQIESE